MTMASGANSIVVCVLGLSRDQGKYFHKQSGIGKSCLCYRFVHPGFDDYIDDHPSLLALHEFESPAINNVHFLYWGSVTHAYPIKGTIKEDKVEYHIVEHTVLYQDVTSQPFTMMTKPDNPELYARRATGPIESSGKISYYTRDAIMLLDSYKSQQYPSHISKVPRGFIVVIDVSLKDAAFDSQLERAEHILAYLMKHKRKYIIVTTKRDITNPTSLDKTQQLQKKYRTQLVETSSMSGLNITAAFRVIAAKILRKVQALTDHVPTYEEAARVFLVEKGGARRSFSDFQKKRVNTSSERLEDIEGSEEYKHTVQVLGKFETDKLFAERLIEIRNAEVGTYAGVPDNVDMRLEFLEDFLDSRSDLSLYKDHLRRWIQSYIDKEKERLSNAPEINETEAAEGYQLFEPVDSTRHDTLVSIHPDPATLVSDPATLVSTPNKEGSETGSYYSIDSLSDYDDIQTMQTYENMQPGMESRDQQARIDLQTPPVPSSSVPKEPLPANVTAVPKEPLPANVTAVPKEPPPANMTAVPKEPLPANVTAVPKEPPPANMTAVPMEPLPAIVSAVPPTKPLTSDANGTPPTLKRVGSGTSPKPARPAPTPPIRKNYSPTLPKYINSQPQLSSQTSQTSSQHQKGQTSTPVQRKEPSPQQSPAAKRAGIKDRASALQVLLNGDLQVSKPEAQPQRSTEILEQPRNTGPPISPKPSKNRANETLDPRDTPHHTDVEIKTPGAEVGKGADKEEVVYKRKIDVIKEIVAEKRRQKQQQEQKQVEPPPKPKESSEPPRKMTPPPVPPKPRDIHEIPPPIPPPVSSKHTATLPLKRTAVAPFQSPVLPPKPNDRELPPIDIDSRPPIPPPVSSKHTATLPPKRTAVAPFQSPVLPPKPNDGELPLIDIDSRPPIPIPSESKEYLHPSRDTPPTFSSLAPSSKPMRELSPPPPIPDHTPEMLVEVGHSKLPRSSSSPDLHEQSSGGSGQKSPKKVKKQRKAWYEGVSLNRIMGAITGGKKDKSHSDSISEPPAQTGPLLSVPVVRPPAFLNMSKRPLPSEPFTASQTDDGEIDHDPEDYERIDFERIALPTSPAHRPDSAPARRAHSFEANRNFMVQAGIDRIPKRVQSFESHRPTDTSTVDSYGYVETENLPLQGSPARSPTPLKRPLPLPPFKAVNTESEVLNSPPEYDYPDLRVTRFHTLACHGQRNRAPLPRVLPPRTAAHKPLVRNLSTASDYVPMTCAIDDTYINWETVHSVQSAATQAQSDISSPPPVHPQQKRYSLDDISVYMNFPIPTMFPPRRKLSDETQSRETSAELSVHHPDTSVTEKPSPKPRKRVKTSAESLEIDRTIIEGREAPIPVRRHSKPIEETQSSAVSSPTVTVGSTLPPVPEKRPRAKTSNPAVLPPRNIRRDPQKCPAEDYLKLS